MVVLAPERYFEALVMPELSELAVDLRSSTSKVCTLELGSAQRVDSAASGALCADPKGRADRACEGDSSYKTLLGLPLCGATEKVDTRELA